MPAMNETTLAPVDLAQRVGAIIDAVMNGMALREAIKSHGMKLETFHNALIADKALSRRYALAQEFRADLMADEMIHIADSDADPAKVRNQVTVRQWLSSKFNQRKYGERIDLNVAQTIDIGATLAEARNRALSARYQQTLEHVQFVDSIDVSLPRPTDKQSVINIGSVDVPKPGDAPNIFD